MSDTVLLKAAREETHAAVQLIAMIPRSLLVRDPSDTSASLIWDQEFNMLITQEVKGFRAGFKFESQDIHIYEGQKRVSILPTIGNTYDQIFESLKESLTELGLEGKQMKKVLPYELPQSVLTRGVPFEKQNSEALSTLSRLYALTADMLGRVFKNHGEASEIRCWPHHYDLATLVTIEAHEDPEKAKSIGFGLSPGDSHYDTPYFYLTPWPYPDKNALYSLTPPAFWNTKGWVGGVLKAADLGSGDIQDAVLDFFENGYDKLKDIL